MSCKLRSSVFDPKFIRMGNLQLERCMSRLHWRELAGVFRMPPAHFGNHSRSRPTFVHPRGNSREWLQCFKAGDKESDGRKEDLDR